MKYGLELNRQVAKNKNKDNRSTKDTQVLTWKTLNGKKHMSSHNPKQLHYMYVYNNSVMATTFTKEILSSLSVDDNA